MITHLSQCNHLPTIALPAPSGVPLTAAPSIHPPRPQRRSITYALSNPLARWPSLLTRTGHRMLLPSPSRKFIISPDSSSSSTPFRDFLHSSSVPISSPHRRPFQAQTHHKDMRAVHHPNSMLCIQPQPASSALLLTPGSGTHPSTVPSTRQVHAHAAGVVSPPRALGTGTSPTCIHGCFVAFSPSPCSLCLRGLRCLPACVWSDRA